MEPAARSLRRTVALAIATIVLLGSTLAMTPMTPWASAQAIDCSTTEWIADSSAALATAATCWNDATEPGDYTVTLAADTDGTLAFYRKSGDFSLRIDGDGHIHQGGLWLDGEDSPSANDSHISVTNLRVGGSDAAFLAVYRVYATLLDVSVTDSAHGLDISQSSVTIDRLSVDQTTTDQAIWVGPESTVLIENSAIFDNAGFALGVSDAVVLIRNAIVRHNAGGITADNAEVVVERSSIIDNDQGPLGWQHPGVSGRAVISIINSTVAAHDAHVPKNVGVGSPAAGIPSFPATIRVANSTIVDNGNYDLAGPVNARSSLIGRCDVPTALDGEFQGSPVDDGANVGGCFGDTSTMHYPPADNGCAVPTVIGCTPTIATAESSPSRGTGECANTLIVDPAVDLFAVDLLDLQTSQLTTQGVQSVDQRGFDRVGCDAGAIDSGSPEPEPQLKVLSWVAGEPRALDAGSLPICCDAATGASAADLAARIDTLDTDLVLLQNHARGALPELHLIEALSEELERRDRTMIHDFAATFDFQPAPGSFQHGSTVLTDLPIARRSATPLDGSVLDSLGRSGGLIHEVVLVHPDELIRVVSLVGIVDSPCDTLVAFEDWLDTQPVLTTIVAADLETDRTDACVGTGVARWIDACDTERSDPTCAGTAIDAPEATIDYLLHRPAALSSMAFDSAQVLGPVAGSASRHAPLAANYRMDQPGPADLDLDGVADVNDICPAVSDVDQLDFDADGIGDLCDPVLGGDANCDAGRDIVDALVIVQLSVGIRTDVPSCPLDDPLNQAFGAGGDVNGDRITDVVDALLITRCSVGIDNSACPAP